MTPRRQGIDPDKTKDCDHCSGTGVVHGYTCQVCAGHGWTVIAEDIVPARKDEP